MVLESLINPIRAESRPWALLMLGFMYATVGLFLGLWIFEEYASMIMVFLTTMAAIPLVYNTIKLEESKDYLFTSERTLLKEHAKALNLFFFFFLGTMIAFSLWYVMLPSDVSSLVFSSQTQTINNLNQDVTGNFFQGQQAMLFTKIFLNNLKVMIFCILFSFLYGSGAIFILTWNASVVGAAIGNFIRTHIAMYALSLGFKDAGSYFYVISLSLARYLIHCIPEVLGYIVA